MGKMLSAMVLVGVLGLSGCNFDMDKMMARGRPVSTLESRQRQREEGRGSYAHQWKSGKPRYGPAPEQPKYNGYSGLRKGFGGE